MKKLIYAQKKIKCSWLMTALLAACLMVCASAALAETNVYVEGAYDDSTLALYVYTDITEDAPLVSQCVKVTFNGDILDITSVEKNDDVWYFGKGGPEYDYDVSPKVGDDYAIILGGKLDTDAPTEGVTGERVLLGKVFFDRVPGTNLDFNVGIQLGKAHPFANFVETSGNVQDEDNSVTFGEIRIFERGDANASGGINVQDMSAVRYYLVNGGDDHPWMDCNGVGGINVQDMSCIRYKMTH